MANLYLAQECILHQEYSAAFEILHAALRDDATDTEALNMLHELEIELTPSVIVDEHMPAIATSNFWPDGGATYNPYGTTHIPWGATYAGASRAVNMVLKNSTASRHGTTHAIDLTDVVEGYLHRSTVKQLQQSDLKLQKLNEAIGLVRFSTVVAASSAFVHITLLILAPKTASGFIVIGVMAYLVITLCCSVMLAQIKP